MVIDIDDRGYNEFVRQKGVTLVEFWAEWCVYCKQMERVLEEIDDKNEGRVQIAKINVELHQETAEKYGVQSLPTLLAYKDGVLAGKVNGYVPAEQLQNALKQIM